MRALSNREFILRSSNDNVLLDEVLIKPSEDCDELHILSGYAASSMVKRHLELLDEFCAQDCRRVRLKIIVGMIPVGGLSVIEHEGFRHIVSSRSDVECSYVMAGRPPTHAKVYVWLKQGIPQKAFVGSANYSQNAFFGSQIEIMTSADPFVMEEFFQSYSCETAYCNTNEIEDMVSIVSEREFKKRIREIENNPRDDQNFVTLSLLTADGTRIGDASSLNWGQRKGREPNQAYIPIPRKIGKLDFFPGKETIFTVMTDDGIVLQCVVEGNMRDDIPKQITTSKNNSELGLYVRKRLGVSAGAKVSIDDLKKYGRTDVVFINLGDGTYYMDFSKPAEHNEIIG